MKTPYTKGPWIVSPDNARKIHAPHALNGLDPLTGENLIAGVSVHPDAVANARLLACAPEMLEMLIAVRCDVLTARGHAPVKGPCRDAINTRLERLDTLITRALSISLTKVDDDTWLVCGPSGESLFSGGRVRCWQFIGELIDSRAPAIA